MPCHLREMLRIERLSEAEGIEDELSAYNPLIPDEDMVRDSLVNDLS